MKQRLFPDGETFHYGYDGIRLTSISADAANPAFKGKVLKSADYDALGRMKTIEVGETTGGATLVTNTYSYDATHARLTRVQGAVPGSTPLDLSVVFDGLGRLTSQTGTLGAESVSRSYTYDGLSRLKTAVGPWEKATGATGNVTWTYSYDALGNLRGQASTRTPSNLADVRTWSYAHTTKPRFLSSFAQANQPTETLAATAGGEVSTISRPSLATETLVWNALGKLHQHKSSTYSYDAFGERTLVVTGPSGSTTSIVSVGEDFEYDVGALRSNKYFSVQGVRIASLATSYTAASASMPPSLRIAIRVVQPLAAPAAAGLLALGLVGLASLALRRRTPAWLSVPGVSMLSFTLVALPYTAHAATLTSGPGTYGRHGEPILAYLVDHLGTIRGAVNQAGTVVETRDYAPFGESIAKTGTFAVQHRFTGQPQDDQAGGLYDYGARFYNAKWGRFVSPDEVVQGFDSQGLNPFTYVLNRPTGATDPTGNYILNGFRVDSTWKQEANEAWSAEYAIGRDAAHKRGSATGWTPPAPASSSSHAFAMAGAFSFAPTGGAALTPSEYVMEVARGEFLDVVGGLSGTAGGLAGGFVQALNGILTWSPDTAFEGLLDTLAALVMPRLGRDGGLRYGGDGPTIPASNTKVQKASKWHDDFVAWNGYWNASAQFGWIERAWTGPGVEPGPYGQAYRILGTVGFGIAGALQKIIPF